jgi:hypothetical protein
VEAGLQIAAQAADAIAHKVNFLVDLIYRVVIETGTLARVGINAEII